LSVGFLSFSFNKYTFNKIHFFGTSIDWPLTYLVGSVIFITISILLGLFVAIIRLQDFRVSRRINLIRYRVCNHSEGLLNESTPDEFNFWKRLTLAFHNFPTVTMEECKAYKMPRGRTGKTQDLNSENSEIFHTILVALHGNSRCNKQCISLSVSFFTY